MRTWKEFWLQQQQDLMEVLENNIFNFATFLGLTGLIVKAYYPQHYDSFNSLVTGYLLVAPSAVKTLASGKNN